MRNPFRRFILGRQAEIIPHLVIVDRFGKIRASNEDNHGNGTDPLDTIDALKKLLAAALLN